MELTKFYSVKVFLAADHADYVDGIHFIVYEELRDLRGVAACYSCWCVHWAKPILLEQPDRRARGGYRVSRASGRQLRATRCTSSGACLLADPGVHRHRSHYL